MPVSQHRQYAVYFDLPDGRHIASLNSVNARTDAEKRFVTRAAMRAISSNPDAKLVDIIPLQGDPTEHLRKLVEELYAANPDRVGAETLPVPNAILHDVEIPRGLAAQGVPG